MLGTNWGGQEEGIVEMLHGPEAVGTGRGGEQGQGRPESGRCGGRCGVRGSRDGGQGSGAWGTGGKRGSLVSVVEGFGRPTGVLEMLGGPDADGARAGAEDAAGREDLRQRMVTDGGGGGGWGGGSDRQG